MNQFRTIFVRAFRPGFLLLLLLSLLVQFATFAQSDSAVVDTVRSKGRIFPSPLLGYSPETRLYFGAGIVWYLPPSKKYPATNASVIKVVGVYTLNKQIESNLSGETWFRNNLYKFDYTTSYFKFPDAFYGIGNNTQIGDKETYGYDFFNIQLNGQRLMWPNIYGGVKLFAEHTSVYNILPGGFFDTQEIPGEEGGWNTGMGPWITYDTRDNIYFPVKGMQLNLSAVWHDEIFGSIYPYTHYELELSQFNKIMKDDVLGFNVYAEGVPGEPPFNRLAEMGGDKQMRGHFEGRYRDKNYITAQAEYRITFWKYFAINIFGGIGEVAPDLASFTVSGLKYSFGAGGRLFIVPEDKLSLRVDYGFDGEGNGGLYITFREAF